jgi:hypothetical protein
MICNISIATESELKTVLSSHLGSDVELHAVNGGLLNRFENMHDSIIKVQTTKKCYMLKVGNSNQNIQAFFQKSFDSIDFSVPDIIDLLSTLSLLPSRKEIDCYNMLSTQNDAFVIDILPHIEMLMFDNDNRKSYILMQDLSAWNFFDYTTPVEINSLYVETAIKNLSVLHNALYSHDELVKRCIPDITTFEFDAYSRNRVYFDSIPPRLASLYHDSISARFYNMLMELPSSLVEAIRTNDSSTKILTHNDFNIRNTCFINPSPRHIAFKVFDWDLCCRQNPAFDFFEYCTFLFEPISEELFSALIDLYLMNSIFINEKRSFIDCMIANAIIFIAKKWCIYASLLGIDRKFLIRLSTNIETYIEYLFKI